MVNKTFRDIKVLIMSEIYMIERRNKLTFVVSNSNNKTKGKKYSIHDAYNIHKSKILNNLLYISTNDNKYSYEFKKDYTLNDLLIELNKIQNVNDLKQIVKCKKIDILNAIFLKITTLNILFKSLGTENSKENIKKTVIKKVTLTKKLKEQSIYEYNLNTTLEIAKKLRNKDLPLKALKEKKDIFGNKSLYIKYSSNSDKATICKNLYSKKLNSYKYIQINFENEQKFFKISHLIKDFNITELLNSKEYSLMLNKLNMKQTSNSTAKELPRMQMICPFIAEKLNIKHNWNEPIKFNWSTIGDKIVSTKLKSYNINNKLLQSLALSNEMMQLTLKNLKVMPNDTFNLLDTHTAGSIFEVLIYLTERYEQFEIQEFLLKSLIDTTKSYAKGLITKC